MNNQQTPLEKLISDKERIQRQCKRQEQKLNEDFSYIQENAGSLLLSGLSSLLFPSNKSTTKTNDKNTAPVTAGQPSIALGISDYLSIAKGMIPIAWDLAQPFIMTWERDPKRWESKKRKDGSQISYSRKRNNLQQLIYVRGQFFSRYIIRLNTKNMTTFAVVKARIK